MKVTKIRHVLILSVAALISNIGYAEPRYWMKRDNFEELGLWVNLSGKCPFSKEELTKQIKGEFLRARIKPIMSGLEFNLTAHVVCMEIENVGGELLSYSIAASIFFGEGTMLFDSPYMGVAAGPPDSTSYLMDLVVSSVETAITDYLEANIIVNHP